MLLRSLVILDECHGAQREEPHGWALTAFEACWHCALLSASHIGNFFKGQEFIESCLCWGEGDMCSTQRRRTCCSFSLFLQSCYRRSWSDSRWCRCFYGPKIVKVTPYEKSIKHIQAANVRKRPPLEERPRILGLTASFLSGSLKRSLAEKKKPFKLLQGFGSGALLLRWFGMLFFTIRNVLTGLQLVELQKHKPPIVCIDMFAIKQPIRGSPSLGFMHDCMAACLALVWKQLSILAGFRRGQWVSCSILLPINRAEH